MSMHSLLVRRRFAPLFVAQFLGAAADNVFKNALVMWAVFSPQAGTDPALVGLVAGALFVLPFVLVSAWAGQWADRRDKAVLIRRIKLAEIGLALLAAAAFAWGQVWPLLAVLTLAGGLAAWFGPLKYAILPDHLYGQDLVDGNALVEAATFVAILVGTIVGGIVVVLDGGRVVIGAVLVVLAVAAWAAARFIPSAPVDEVGLAVDVNPLRATRAVLARARANPPAWTAILAISWFWLVGAVVLAQFPALTRWYLGGDSTVVTLLLTVFTVGVGVGSLLCARLGGANLGTRPVMAAGLLLSAALADLALSLPSLDVAPPPLVDLTVFLTRPAAWRPLADLAGIALAGGVFALPLYVALQQRADPAARARFIAANNIMNALFMATGTGALAALSTWLTIPGQLLVLAGANAVAAWAWRRV